MCEGRRVLAATISGIKYATVNDSGFSPGDAPLADVTIELYRDNGDGVFNPMVDSLVDQQQTAPGPNPAKGTYSFANVADGRYFVTEIVPTNYIQSAGPAFYSVDVIGGSVYASSTTNIDNFTDPDPAVSFFINALNADPYFRQDSGPGIIDGQRDLVVDVLGPSNPISASGFVGTIGVDQGALNLGTASSGPGSQLTLQYDGVDVDSAALANAQGMSADLLANGNNGFRLDFNFLQVGTGTTMNVEILATSPGGTASFNGLISQDPGGFSYFVPYSSFSTTGTFTFADVTSLQFAFNQSGVQDVDFEINQIVAAQQRDTGFNFGNFPLPADLRGHKYVDSNNNGQRNKNEPPVKGVIITLTGTNDLGQSVHLQTKTSSNGIYKFNNLRPGTYKLTETAPINFIIGKPTIGSLGGHKTSNLIISNIVTPAAASGTNYNFGERGLTPPYVSKRSLLNPSQPVVLKAVYSTSATAAKSSKAASSTKVAAKSDANEQQKKTAVEKKSTAKKTSDVKLPVLLSSAKK